MSVCKLNHPIYYTFPTLCLQKWPTCSAKNVRLLLIVKFRKVPNIAAHISHNYTFCLYFFLGQSILLVIKYIMQNVNYAQNKILQNISCIYIYSNRYIFFYRYCKYVRILRRFIVFLQHYIIQ